jgi:hypothetical protein
MMKRVELNSKEPFCGAVLKIGAELGTPAETKFSAETEKSTYSAERNTL